MLLKWIVLLVSLLFSGTLALSQHEDWIKYEASPTQPFGQKNPEAPTQLDDFKPMIGICNCNSLKRNSEGTWGDTTQIIWSFKCILNGTAIQDQTWGDNVYASSIRQFHVESEQWVVGYSSFPGLILNGSSIKNIFK